jgi:hypothetical protein
MKPAKIIAGLLVAAALALALPTAASAATSIDVQSQMIVGLQQLVAMQLRCISALQADVAQLQAEVSSLSGGVSYSQYWPIEQSIATTSVAGQADNSTQAAQSNTPAVTKSNGRSCIYNRKAYYEGEVTRITSCGAVCISGLYICHHGRWIADWAPSSPMK